MPMVISQQMPLKILSAFSEKSLKKYNAYNFLLLELIGSGYKT